ncbi:Gfo/Idh/MocA family protein [Armatimonas sp.]|uniref:Gfo/Idh/MocA family protein n=1 Tax=Armatimonas sp. TaxID=1872638 RepID=UPI0037501488
MSTPKMRRAIVIGAGFAGEGHTRALQHCGVEVVGLCGREPEIVRARADTLGISLASNDWRATLEQVRPDIVAIATPAVLRREIIEAAVAQGCHLFCDKPLATTAAEAAALCQLVEAAGVKHAFAATRRYEPSVVWLAELVASGVIGRITQATYHVSAHLSPPLPWSWALSLDQGGGLLNGHFPHLLSILERVLSGTLSRATGQAKFAIDRAPIIPGIHDFRDWGARADTLTPEELESAEWRTCDADTSYSARLRFVTPTGEVPVTLISGPEVGAAQLCLRGQHGTLIAQGEAAFRIFHNAQELPVPERLIAALPKLGGGCEDRWAALAKEFIANICGEPHAPYLTFLDGGRYQEAIEAIRSG